MVSKRMIGFLLWNVHNKDLSSTIAQAVGENRVQVVALVEAPEATDRLIAALDAITGESWRKVFVAASGLVMVTCLPQASLSGCEDDPIYTIDAALLNLPGADEVLVFVAHMPSKWRFSTGSQEHYLRSCAGSIRRREDRRGHRRTILLGDLNANPFDAGMIQPQGLNAVSTRDVAARGIRKVYDDRDEYPFFYNPMWRHFGDAPGSPRGTYYLDCPKPSEFYWNMLDQVLLRPDLLEMAPDPDVRIICQVGGESLLTPSRRPSDKFSDHLPVLCHLDLVHPSGEV